jgi:hypothetical protein
VQQETSPDIRSQNASAVDALREASVAGVGIEPKRGCSALRFRTSSAMGAFPAHARLTFASIPWNLLGLRDFIPERTLIPRRFILTQSVSARLT